MRLWIRSISKYKRVNLLDLSVFIQIHRQKPDVQQVGSRDGEIATVVFEWLMMCLQGCDVRDFLLEGR